MTVQQVQRYQAKWNNLGRGSTNRRITRPQKWSSLAGGGTTRIIA
jgi:hypothetical protein